LKNTGTLYLHCDPTASHYLKIVLDAVFGKERFGNEIIWKRSNPKSHISRNFPTCNDTILRYTKTLDCVYHQSYEEHNPEYVESAYRHKDKKGAYQLLPLLNPNDDRPNLTYEFLGVTRVWRWTKERMEKAYKDGIVVQVKPGAVPRYKKYLKDSKGKTVTNCWTDIQPASSKESVGYPTQKPLALLNRIIQASSNEGDIVLDPFCGCATTCVAAEHLGRKWIGIDIEKKASDILIQRLSLATGILSKFIATDKLPSRSDLKVVKPTESVKNILYKEQRGLCNACGSEFEIRHFETDHIIPKSKGGGDYYENYQLLCGSCNKIKGDRPMEYLRAKIATIELARGKVFFGE
jgi:DNA modification methylase